MKVIYFGTPVFASSILECLLKHGVEIVAVVTKPDKPKGRNLISAPTPVKAFIHEHFSQIPVFQPPKISTPEYEAILRQFNADLFVVVAYGEILKQNILSIPKVACINVHASLLPKYRGAAPIHRSIMNGEIETGVTIMEMALALDAGDVLHVEKMKIDMHMNLIEVEDQLKILGCKGLLTVIEQFKNHTIKRKSQDHDKATYAPKITTEECEIRWNLPAKIIHDLIRGTNPFPGAWCRIKLGDEIKRLKIKKSLIFMDMQVESGSLVEYQHDSFIVGTKKGVVKILEVQLEGKRAMTAAEFIRGYPQIQII